MRDKRRTALRALADQAIVILREGGAQTVVGLPRGSRTTLPRHAELAFMIRDAITLRPAERDVQIDLLLPAGLPLRVGRWAR